MKYPVYPVLGVILGLLSGCSEPVPLEGSTTKGYSAICLNGVQYWETPTHNIAPKYSITSIGLSKDYPDTCS